MGHQDHPREPDCHPFKHAWLWDGCCEQQRLRCILRGVDCKSWGRVRCHTRIGEVPGCNDCIDAGADANNATVLHGARATAPPHHLHVAEATARLLQYIALSFNRQQKQFSPNGVPAAQRISWPPMLVAATHPIQDVWKLELLPFAWQGHQQHSHRHDVPSPRSVAQHERNKDKYNGRQYGGPTQDDSAFRLRSSPTCPKSATSPHPYNKAATPAYRKFYSDDSRDASNDANNPLPGHQLHGSLDLPLRSSDLPPLLLRRLHPFLHLLWE